MPEAPQPDDPRPNDRRPNEECSSQHLLIERAHLHRAWPCLLIVVGLFLATLAHAVPVIVASNQTLIGPLNRTAWIVQDGASPIDTFRITRLARDTSVANLRGTILLLPPLGSSFEIYEQRDANDLFGTSIAEFFAARGFDIWGYSPRFEGIPAGTCEAGVLDCSPMADWNLQSMIDDVSFVRDQIELLDPGTDVVVGGLSLGAMLSIAVANADGARYAGIFPWEGILESADPAVQALNTGYCAAVEAQLAGGIIFDGVGNGIFKKVGQHAADNPDGLTPIPLYPPFLTNRQVLVSVLVDPPSGPVSMPVPGFQQLTPTPAGDDFEHVSGARLIENILTGFNDYTPHAAVRDISCAIAGSDTTHTSNLHLFTGDVLMIGGGHGFGGFMNDQAGAFTSAASVALRVESDFGHVDHFFTRFHRHFVELPIFMWLKNTLGW